MDIEQDVRDSLRRYGDSVEVGVAPLADVARRARRRSRSSAYAVGASVVVLIAVIVAVVVRSDGNGRTVVPADDSTITAPSDQSEPAPVPGKLAALLAPGEARVLPPSPLVGRSDPAAVWTGDVLLIWGGVTIGPNGEAAAPDGAAYDPVANTWTLLPDAPIAERGYPASVWTGTEMLIWGGGFGGTSMSDGAAYDPATRSWRTLAPFPMPSTIRPTTIWTGTEMIVLEGINGSNHGAAYDPAADTWREIAVPPGRSVTPYPQAVWTGDRAIVELGAAPSDQPILAEYDPVADSWHNMDPPPIPSGGRPALVWTGTELLMLGGGQVPRAIWNPTTDAWRTLADTGIQPIGNTPVWTGEAALFWNGGEPAIAYLPATDTWKTLTGGGLSPRESAVTVWADGIFLSWSGFENNPDGTAFGAADGIAWRPDFDSAPVGTTITTDPISTSPAAVPTTAPAVTAPPLESDPATSTTGATEQQLQVLADAFSMPGRPELIDVEGQPGGQTVTVGSRTLAVNVPLAALWQYADLDAQSLPPASNETSDAAARSLLAQLGIDTEGLTATFTPNGPSTQIQLAGCTMMFAEDGRIVSAIGPISAVANS